MKIESTEISPGLRSVIISSPISHPLADEVCLSVGDNSQSSFPESAELSFFRAGNWVDDIISDFSSYADTTSGPAIYTHVPMTELSVFLDRYGVCAPVPF